MRKPVTKGSQYSLDQSPFYKLQTRRKLAALLRVDLRDLQALTKRTDNYRIFEIEQSPTKRREIQAPQGQLESVHRRIFDLLRRIEPPAYLHSGVKGRSYITNARAHLGSPRAFTLDIRKFYPSTKGWHVFEFFNDVMMCNEDVSGLMSNICVVDDHVPTGSCLSQIIAFYAHYSMFEEISHFAQSRDLVMTCYVDDITVSGERANGSALYNIRGMLRRRGLQSAVEKEMKFDIGHPKKITGSIVSGDALLLPNYKHKKIHQLTTEALAMKDGPQKLKLIQRVLGMAVAGSQSDGRMDRTRGALLDEFRRLRRLHGDV